MSKKNEIVHAGKILEITPDFTTVQIIVSSACSSCHAKGLCGMSEEEEKVNFDVLKIQGTLCLVEGL